MPTELIVGGDFEAPGYGGSWTVVDSYGAWGGNDIEVGNHSLYHSGESSSNSVIELDGNSGQTTVLEQSFTVDADGKSATLSFDAGGRNTGGSNADPVLVEVLDDSGNVVFTQLVTPTSSGSFDTFTFNFTFPSSGTYTLRFTEGGSDNSLGTILDNVSLMVCFADGTKIATPNGTVKIENLAVDDLVLTIDGTAKPIRWIGSRKLYGSDLSAHPEAKPILFRKGSLGKNMPEEDLRVSPQHRLLVRSPVAQRVLGEFESLVPAKKLVPLDGIEVEEECREVTYFHILLDEHDIVIAQGAYAESLYLGKNALASLGPEAVSELFFLFPELADMQVAPKPARALRSRKKDTEKLCMRLARNNKPVVQVQP